MYDESMRRSLTIVAAVAAMLAVTAAPANAASRCTITTDSNGRYVVICSTDLPPTPWRP